MPETIRNQGALAHTSEIVYQEYGVSPKKTLNIHVSELRNTKEKHVCSAFPPHWERNRKIRGKTIGKKKDGALDWIRTSGFLLRRQTLYPLSYKGTMGDYTLLYDSRRLEMERTGFHRAGIASRNANDTHRADGVRLGSDRA